MPSPRPAAARSRRCSSTLRPTSRASSPGARSDPQAVAFACELSIPDAAGGPGDRSDEGERAASPTPRRRTWSTSAARAGAARRRPRAGTTTIRSKPTKVILCDQACDAGARHDERAGEHRVRLRHVGAMRRALGLALAVVAVAGCRTADKGPADMAGDAGFVTTAFDLGCASSTAQAQLVPVNLVVLLDASGSMGDGVNGDPALKWNPVTDGLRAFFADSQSLGVSASLALFPAANDVCNPSVYYFATVPMTALPETLDVRRRRWRRRRRRATRRRGRPSSAPSTTPTTWPRRRPASRTAIVLVTDGDPDDCDSSVANVSLEVAKVATTIPTYVIGVGDEPVEPRHDRAVGRHRRADAGVGRRRRPDQERLPGGAARRSAASCSAATSRCRRRRGADARLHRASTCSSRPSAAPAEQLLYDSACSTGVGWRYDDPMTPTKVELCPSSCDDGAQGSRRAHRRRLRLRHRRQPDPVAAAPRASASACAADAGGSRDAARSRASPWARPASSRRGRSAPSDRRRARPSSSCPPRRARGCS